MGTQAKWLWEKRYKY